MRTRRPGGQSRIDEAVPAAAVAGTRYANMSAVNR